jgi:hypothetical protein
VIITQQGVKMKKDLKKIEKLFDKAYQSDSAEDYNRIREHIQSIDNWNTDAELLYLAGLSQYLINDNDADTIYIRLANKWFSESVSLNPKDTMARIYLVYTSYDLGDFQSCISIIKELIIDSLDYLQENDLEWRIVDLLEILAASELKLGHITKFLAYHRQWEDFFNVYIATDDEMVPKQIILTVSEFLSNSGDNLSEKHYLSFKRICMILILFIQQKTHLIQLYKKELELLKNWSGHNQALPKKIKV